MPRRFYTWRTGVYPVAGFLYGLVLACLGFLATGAGHGTYVIAGLASSPVSVIQSIWIALLSPPFIWSYVGFWLGGSAHVFGRLIFLLCMLMHYLGLIWVLRRPSEFADWGYVSKLPEFFAGAVGFYLIGQIAIWVAFCLAIREGRMLDRGKGS